MKNGIRLENLSDERLEEIGRILGDAFFDYPCQDGQMGMRAICTTRKMMRDFLTAYVKAGYASKNLYATSIQEEGYVILTGYKHEFSKEANKQFIKDLFHALGFSGIFRMLTITAKAGSAYKMELRKNKIPFTVLEVLGVKKEFQGKGYMRQLINLVFEIANQEQVNIYVATDDEIKKDKYVHCGFTLKNIRDGNPHFTDYELYREYQK